MRYVVENSEKDMTKWEAATQNVLESGIQDDDISLLMSAATLVAQKIDALGEQAAANWLRSTVGSLKVESGEWIDAIGALACVVLTTNYDTLLEQRLNRATVDRTNIAGFQAAISAKTNDIVHLHGVWTNRDSVVLSSTDYHDVLADSAHQVLQQALSATKSIIYIGFGSGLDDPNFSKLLEWHLKTFPASEIEHYRLCRQNEVSELRKVHVNSNIETISYGEQYDDFPNFIAGLQIESEQSKKNSAGIVRDIPLEARVDMIGCLQNITRLTEETDFSDGISLNSIALPPILLPVPHAEYINQNGEHEDARVKRLDPDTECTQKGVTIVVGDEHSGLTTTLKWLAIRASELSSTKIPIYISFDERQPGAKPLNRLLRREALDKGIIEGRLDDLPELAVAIDDFSPYVSKISNNTLIEISNTATADFFIGCRTGDEAEIADRLKNLGIECKVRYVGKLNFSDVTALAKIAAPLSHHSVTQKIVSVLRAERLPRNPFTITLLISILLKGEVINSEASPTGILDQYINLLVGRGDPTVDTRHSVGAEQSITALSALSESFFRRECSILPESEAIEKISELINAYAWPETATDMLREFAEKRLISIRSGGVSFARSSYLHLFAAKWAQREPDFLDFILLNPLRFAPVVRHYAALMRRDERVIQVMTDLISDFKDGTNSPPVYEDLSKMDAPVSLVKYINDDTEGGFDSKTEEANLHETSMDPLDSLSDSDPSPFPELDESEISYLSRFRSALDTASAVVRDSDEVRDLKKKQDLLERVVHGWGSLLGLLSEDQLFIDLQKSIIDELKETDTEFFEEHAELLTELLQIIPCAIVAGGIENSLSSRKLLVTLDKISNNTEFFEDRMNAVSTSMLLYSIKEPGWLEKTEKAISGHESAWALNSFMLALYIDDYVNGNSSAIESSRLLDFSATMLADRWNYPSGRERTAAVDAFRNRLRNDKLSAARRAKSISAASTAIRSSLGTESR
ncbi:SIR2 family NAD-dependent protein deacylase [Rhodococcus sp. OK302]|uniref:SIR2 family NAD-dependent protein deacylase n=1 Tax=Rhodococcus sp. OK302 TaxID=1882769 RepID=UPI0015956784|nr:SIR2 family protein [Rhodococcus sp. OK302]